MAWKTILVLEDSSAYEGYSFGAEVSTYVESCYLEGFLEMLRGGGKLC